MAQEYYPGAGRRVNHLPGMLQLFSLRCYEKMYLQSRREGVCQMAVAIDEKEAKMIEEMALNSEILIAADDERKDLKEKRGIIKQTLYDGSHKLKHLIPKGKHL